MLKARTGGYWPVRAVDRYEGLSGDFPAAQHVPQRTQELLAALRRRRQVLTILIAAVLTALLLWVAALCVSLYDYHQAYNGWSETSIIEEPSPYGQ